MFYCLAYFYDKEIKCTSKPVTSLVNKSQIIIFFHLFPIPLPRVRHKWLFDVTNRPVRHQQGNQVITKPSIAISVFVVSNSSRITQVVWYPLPCLIENHTCLSWNPSYCFYLTAHNWQK